MMSVKGLCGLFPLGFFGRRFKVCAVMVVFLFLCGYGQNSDSYSNIILPDSLIQFVKRNIPDFHIPTKKDMHGNWAAYIKTGELPFMCKGDFDGNGKVDFALLLIGTEEWRLFSFHQVEDNKYEAIAIKRFPGPNKAYMKSPPQRFRLQCLKAGETLVFNNTPVDTSKRKLDSIIFLDLDNSDRVLQFRWSMKYKFYGTTSYSDLVEPIFDK